MPTTPNTLAEEHQGQEDLRLTRRAREGDAEALELFVERMRCIPRILAVKNRRAGSPLASEDLADLAQDVFGTVWRRLDSYAGEASLESWVFRFCVLMLMDAVRRRSRRPVPLAGSEEGPASEPPGGGGARQAAVEPLDYEHVHAALDRLPREESEVVVLKQFDGLTFERIAERLNLSPNTAKTRYYRGLERLRGLLAVPLGEGER